MSSTETDAAYIRVDSEDPEVQTQVEQALQPPSFDSSIPIGVVGCGWVAGMQLEAYVASGLNVVALCDHSIERATAYRDRYYPDATVYASEDELFAHPGLRIVDVATHVDGRTETIRSALAAGKHVLSQKPFVDDLVTGRALAIEAESLGLTLAVNQNGRWAPHLGALLACVNAGVIGEVLSADFFVAWPHDLVVADKPAFAGMADLILFDFGAHWFDVLGQLVPSGSAEVRAVVGSRTGQAVSAPVQATAVVTTESFMGSVSFRAAERFAEIGTYRVSGTLGVVSHSGASLGGTEVQVVTERGEARISTGQDWFRHGMTGTMRELLASISHDRPPLNSAVSALRGLELCFAAVESAATGSTVVTSQSTRRHHGRNNDNAS